MKKFLTKKGVKILSKEEQTSVNGGGDYITVYCGDGFGTSFRKDDPLLNFHIGESCKGHGGVDELVESGHTFIDDPQPQ